MFFQSLCCANTLSGGGGSGLVEITSSSLLLLSRFSPGKASPGKSTGVGCHCLLRQLFAVPWIVAYWAPLSMGFSQARILEWVAMPSSSRSPPPRDHTHVSCLASRFFTTELPGKPQTHCLLLSKA